MGRVPKIAGLLVLGTLVAAGLAAGLAVFLSFEREPRLVAMGPPRPMEVAQLGRALKAQDPRRLEPGETGTLSLSDQELALALRQGLALLGTSEAVQVELEPGRLAVKASVKLPRAPLGRFLNVDLVLLETDHLPRFERLGVGRTRVPARLADAGWRWAITDWLKLQGGAEVLEMVEAVTLGPDRVEVTYRWQPWTADLVRAGIIGAADRERVEAYSEELAAVTRELASGAVSLADLLGPVFDLARRRSIGGNPIAENRAALVVLGSYANRQRLEVLIPDAAEWPRPRWLEPTLHGQYDLARHFVTSAMVAAVGGGALADALGLDKELEDGQGGSGFSFRDLAADRAGSRFGQLAVGSRTSARRLQRLLEDNALDALLLPPVGDLPDALSDAELRHLVGEVGSPAYRKMTAKIDRRIRASRLYRAP